MIMLLFFVVPALLYGAADLVPEIRSGGWKLPAVYLALMTGALVLWVCVLHGVPLKSPSDFVTDLVKAVLPPLG
jgi:hypothetical protein